jgi:maleate isomerase
MDGLVWRAKIGLITTGGQLITEPRYYGMAPPGVAFYTTRMLNPGTGPESLVEMERNAPRAVEELASARVDAIAYCCTVSGALRGLQGDRAFCQDVEAKWGIPTTSTMLAAVEALQHLGIRQVVVTSPYREEHHESERAYLEEAGIHPLRMRGMGLNSGREYSAVPPQEIYRFSLEAWDDRADGLFISCMNFDGLAAAQALEERIHKPVITSHTATLWRALTLAGIEDPIPGYGRLLATRRPAARLATASRP